MPKLKIDMHIHTHYSHDGFSSPREVILRARELGFDAVSITDHCSTKGAVEAKKLAKKLAPKLLVIIGQEAKTNHGDFLVYRIKKSYPKGVDLKALSAVVKRTGGHLIAPHPFDSLRSGIGGHIHEALGYIDAMESFNGRTYISRYNKKAENFAKQMHIPGVAFSDAHHTREFGNTYTIVNSRSRTEKSIFSAIRAGRVELVREKTGFAAHFRATLLKTLFAGKAQGTKK